jgi:hypothetical protein
VLQPWPIDAAVAHGTDPRTPQNVISIASAADGGTE